MKRLVLALAAASLALPMVAVPALADPPAAPPAAQVYVVPTVTVYGRVPKPLVLIVVKRPTAAQEAGAAHETLQASTLARSEPASLQSR